MSTTEPFIGRHEDLETLLDVTKKACEGHGRIVFIEGSVGVGKTSLLGEVRKRVRKIHDLADSQFVSVTCYEETGSQNAYQPFVEIIDQLYSATIQKKETSKQILSIIEEVGPDWLNLIPVVGAVLSVGAKTAIKSKHTFLDADDRHQANLPKVLAVQYLNMIVKIAEQYKCLFITIRATEWIDEASCQLLLRLSNRIYDLPIVIALSYSPSRMDSRHPFSKTQLDIRSNSTPEIIELEGFTQEEINEYILSCFGNTLNPNLASYLYDLSNGHPLFISQYLKVLEQQNIIKSNDGGFIFSGAIQKVSGHWEPKGALAGLPVPNRIEAVIEQRIQRLKEEEKDMLLDGAVQGEFFMPSILAELSEKKERHILKELRQVVDRYGVINYYEDKELTEEMDAYAFEHILMHQAFYNKLSPRERVLLHKKVAEILEPQVKDQENPSLKLIIEVARHYDLGRQPLEAAKHYYFAARKTFVSGAYGETIGLCQKGLKNIRTLGDGASEQDRLQVEMILLMLRVSEMRWRGTSELQGDMALDPMIEEAESAAIRTEDKSLLAKIIFIKGLIYISTHSLSEALDAMNKAVKIATDVGDVALEFSILPILGHHTVSQNLNEGLEILYRALNIHLDHFSALRAREKPPEINRLFHRLQGYIGVAEFDRGNFGIAHGYLKKSNKGFNKLGFSEEMIPPLSFLSQLRISLGCFEEAETSLRDALDILKEDDESNPWRGYIFGLLGKLYLEWGRFADAANALEKGWQETQATKSAALISIVRNYFSELMMHPDNPKRDLSQAQKFISETLKETKSSGFHRSAIWAFSMQGQLELFNQNPDEAHKHSTRAVDYLKKVGIMPALRVEEIYFNHAKVLQAAGDAKEAQNFCRQAHEVLVQKAGSIREPHLRESYLQRVPLSKAIMTAMERVD